MGNPVLASYSFLSVQGTIVGPGGSFNLGNGSGAAEEGIDIEQIEDKDTMTVGADGGIMHSLHASDAARVTLRLLKTSPTNALLSALYNFQKANPGLWGQNVVVISDIYRGDVETLTQLAFNRQAPNKYAKDGNTMEWTFSGNRQSLLGNGSVAA